MALNIGPMQGSILSYTHHCGLSLRGGFDCPAPLWNLEPGTYTNMMQTSRNELFTRRNLQKSVKFAVM